MTLTLDEVEEIAELARLALSESELRRFQPQLSAILDYARVLERLDTTDVPPTANVTGLSGVMREDTIEASLTQEEALANAPATQDGFVVVPTVLDES